MREELPTARLRLGQLVIGCLASMAAACGDGPICASDISVFITTPDNGETVPGGDGFGTMAEVTVRTNLRPTEMVELTVRDQFGLEFFSTAVPVDGSGTAFMPFVFMPPGRVTLQARGITEQCGTGEDVIEVEVGPSVDGDCDISVLQPPLSDPDFAPLPLYSGAIDANLAVDGFQASFDVFAPASYQVDLVLKDLRTGIETLAGTRFTDFDGRVSYTMTMPEGQQELVARCTALDGTATLTSPAFQVHVDTQPPICSLDAPVPGEDITPAMDLDGDPSNGVQIELQGASFDQGPDPLPTPPALFRVGEVRFEGVSGGGEGESAVTVTLENEGVYFIGIEAQDRAGNSCAQAFDFTYTGGSTITVDAVTRHSVALSWRAPGSDQFGLPASEYELHIADTPIDEFNFEFTGERHDTPPPSAPGVRERVVVEGLTPGTTVHAALVARNEVGDARFLGAVGPLEIGFDATPAIAPVSPQDDENGLGYQIAAGDFNGDGFGDVAASAPFKSVGGLGGAGTVYVYFGGPDGLATTPGVIIEGDQAGGQFGTGLTAIRWNDDAIDDLAVGAPFANTGQGLVAVFHGGDNLESLLGAGHADLLIFSSDAPGNWFEASGLGFALTRARFDGDARDDLVISAPGGGGGNGGVVVLYGGSAPTNSMVLDSRTAAGSGDARAVVLQDPDPGSIFGSDPGAFFGQYVFPLGRTQGLADIDDDIGVAYTEKNAAVVFRGRAQPASPGVALATFDPARDLEIQRTSSDDTSSRFGTSMGTIDVNNDGVRDIVVGIWRDLANLGRIEIYRGNSVGVRNASTIRLRSITPGTELCGASGCGLGSAIVNNAAGLVDPDVNGDGVEDLIVVGGMDAGGVRLLVWFGGSLPAADFTSSTASYVVSAPSEFVAGARGASDATPLTALWAGDVNDDGLEDICWADWSAQGRDGAFQVLYDDGQ